MVITRWFGTQEGELMLNLTTSSQVSMMFPLAESMAQHETEEEKSKLREEKEGKELERKYVIGK